MADDTPRSVAVDAQLNQRLRQAAADAGLSVRAWLATCAKGRVHQTEPPSADELDDLFGPLTAQERDELDQRIGLALAEAEATHQRLRAGTRGAA